MKRNFNENIDKKIAECLNNKAKEVSTPENMYFKVRSEILKKNNGGVLNMKFGFLKVKTMLIAGILCIATTVTCVAGTNSLSWSSSGGSQITDIKKFPTEDKVKDTVGFIPKYVESFDGGFKFKSFNHSKSELKNDSNDTLTKTKSIEFEYDKDGADKNKYLELCAEKIEEKYFHLGTERSNEEIVDYDGMKIYYCSFKYKSVPETYVKTAEDLKQIDSGFLQIGYGSESDEISEYNMQSVCWYEDGIKYLILNSNYDDVNKDQMIEMSKKVINQ